MRQVLALVACILLAPGAYCAPSGLIKGNLMDNLHNLSTTGRGQFKSETESRICIFCHTPHSTNPAAPLWNRSSNGFTNYQSSTMDATRSNSAGASALCLSCHDGTIALGDVTSNKRKYGGSARDMRGKFLKGRSNLNADLSNDHPVAISYDLRLQLADQSLAAPTSVDLPINNNELHCTTCHDPHSDRIPPFLNKSTINGELCITCHELSGATWEWSSSSHAISVATPFGSNPWPERKASWKGENVKENACMNCHSVHNAATPAKLINDKEEETCFRCHNGTLAKQNIKAENQKFSRHPVEQVTGAIHSASHRGGRITGQLHVECEDCHNPHASRSDSPMISFNPASPMDPNHSTPPFANGSLIGVSGIDINGIFKPEVEYEYEVCFKCHGVPTRSACDNHRCSTALSFNMSRQDRVYNLRDKFDPGNPALLSYHPIANNNPSNDTETPSLRRDIPLYQASSRIYCGDCHSSNSSPAAGSSGPAGPHGSRHKGILALDYEFSPNSNFNLSSGQLCFKCHDVGNLYSNASFPHRQHVLDNRKSCINCHDPHGSAIYPHLINFLTSSNASGQTLVITGTGIYSEPTWEDNGQFSGTCYLNCHGAVHDGTSYGTMLDGSDFGTIPNGTGN